MSIGLGHRLALFLLGILWQGLLSAAVVTVDFEGTISTATPVNSITSNISATDKIVGTYTYDTAIQDCISASPTCTDVTAGSYENAVTELYINISGKPYYWHLGKYTGKLTGLVETLDSTGADKLTIASTESAVVAGTPLDTNPLVNLQLQFLQSSTPDFLNSDALPLTLPPDTTPGTVCLRFTAAVTSCGAEAADVLLEFTLTNLERVDRYQWANPLPQGNTLLDMTWSDTHQMYVAVGQNGAIATSSNGIGWVNRNVLTNESLLSLALGNGNYVAVSKDKILSSSDNTVWKESETIPLGTNWEFSDVIWDGGKFVVVGKHFPNDVLVYTSVDGNVWTADFPTGKRLSKVTSNGSLFVGIVPAEANQLLTSPDLKTWTATTTQPDKPVYDVIWNGSLFVVVGALGTIYTSVDGLDWMPRSSGSTTLLNGIEWLNGEFIALGRDGVILRGSPDGVTWSSQRSGNTIFQAASFDGTDYVVVGEKGKILISSDAINWQESSSGLVENFNDAVWTGNEFVAVGNNGSIAVSTNGVDWEFQSPLGVVNLKGVGTNTTGGTGTHVAVGSNGAVFRSVDPKTGWTLVRGDSAGDGISDVLNRVLWIDSQFIAVGQNGLIITSPDGSNWTSRASNNLHELTDLVAYKNYIVVVGKQTATNAAVVMTSTDGVSWQSQQSESVINMTGLLSVTWSGNEFLASAGSFVANDLFSSHDGVTWSAYGNASTLTGIEYVRWVGNQYIGVGSRLGRNDLFSSPDGIDWTVEPTYFSGEINYGIAKSADNLIIVSNSGGINYKTGTYSNNFYPYADTGVDQFVQPGETVIINATATDTDDPSPIITFEQTAGDAVTDLDASLLTIEFVGPIVTAPTEYVFTLTATDNLGFVSTDEVTITVAPNQAPTAVDAGVDQDVIADNIVTMIGSGQDPENRGLTYSWLQIANSQGTIESTVTLVDADKAETRFRAPLTETDLSLTFRLTVTDDGGLTATDDINVVVSPVPVVQKPAAEKSGGALFYLLPLLLIAWLRNYSSRSLLLG